MSCDEAVIRILGEEQRKTYAMSLLKMVELKKDRLSVTTAMFGSKRGLKQRVLTVAKRHRRSLLAAFLALAALGIALGCGMMRVETDETDAGQERNVGEGSYHEETVQEPAAEQIREEASSEENGEVVEAAPANIKPRESGIVSTSQLFTWQEAINRGLKQETTDHMELYDPLSDTRRWALLDEELSKSLQETVAKGKLLEDQNLSGFMGARENELFNSTDVMTVWAGGVPYYLHRGTEDRLWIFCVENDGYRISDDKTLIETLLDKAEKLTGWKTHTIGELKGITEVTLLAQGNSYGTFTDERTCRNLEILLEEMRPCSAGYLGEYFATLLITTGDGEQHTVVLDPLNGDIYLPWMGFYRFPRMMNVEYSDLMLHGFPRALGLERWPWEEQTPEREELEKALSWTEGATGTLTWLSADDLGEGPMLHSHTTTVEEQREILRCLMDADLETGVPERYSTMPWIHVDFTDGAESLTICPTAAPGGTRIVLQGTNNLVLWSHSYDLWQSYFRIVGRQPLDLEEHSIASLELRYAEDLGLAGKSVTDDSFLNETALYVLAGAAEDQYRADLSPDFAPDTELRITLKDGTVHQILLNRRDNDPMYVCNGVYCYSSADMVAQLWTLIGHAP